MKILVTGGAGFIGSHLSRHLLARKDTIIILDDFNNRYDPRLKEARIKYMFNDVTAPHVERGDIRNRLFVDTLFLKEQFDKVVHLAAWASVQTSMHNPHIYIDVNIGGTVNILEAARKHNVQHVVFASSSSVYGNSTKLPYQETADISQPISPYAATKASGEILCATWHNLYKLPITCLRFFNVYGPWGRPDSALFSFTAALLSNKPILMRGKHTGRDFTYIDDIVQGIVAALEQPMGYAIFNLGRGELVSLPRYIEALAHALNKSANIVEVPLPAGDIPLSLADITSARAQLEYSPRTSIEEGIKHFATWYRSWYVPHFAPAHAAEKIRA